MINDIKHKSIQQNDIDPAAIPMFIHIELSVDAVLSEITVFSEVTTVIEILKVVLYFMIISPLISSL